jgi:hypothetical protein
MLEPFRSEFNERFTEAKYAELLRRLDTRARTKVEFRVAETPCFFSREMMQTMAYAGAALTHELLGNAEYRKAAEAAVPEKFCVPGCDARPHFMTVDFGLVRDDAGALKPKLVELQAFPSIYGYQQILAEEYVDVYGVGAELTPYFGGMDAADYWAKLREVIVGRHAPENVVLLEVTPEEQKTLPDFHAHEDMLGICTVDIARVIKRGRRLFYKDASGREVRIERIYNRAIVDEIERRAIALPFDYRDDLDVEWAGHPNWYFKISKLSLPYLRHESVPQAVFLDDWFEGRGVERLPADRSRWILKPLYSFAGKGITFEPTDADLNSISVADRRQYLLQERVSFEPVIRTPEGMTQAEIRILYVWPEGQALTPMISLVRMGRGLMMGVDHNRDRTWVGGSAGLFQRQAHTNHLSLDESRHGEVK